MNSKEFHDRKVNAVDIMEAIETRHSVRRYTHRPIEQSLKDVLEQEITSCNQESGLHIQLLAEEPGAFASLLAHYGRFRGVKNYFALIGKEDALLEEKAGYYGERLVLKAQELGLNTCWVAATFSRKKCRCAIGPGEKLVCVISVGYGADMGASHKNKSLDSLCSFEGTMPDWFKRGMEAAILAPTAMNQQKFHMALQDQNIVKARATGGAYSQIDLGIVKYHFEAGAGTEHFQWAE